MRAKSLALVSLVAALVGGFSSAPPAWADEPGPAGSASARSGSVDGFLTGGDSVHYSSTPPPTISAHGWWLDRNSGGHKARVTVELQVLDRGVHWRTVAKGSKVVKQGGGSSRRANARKTCEGSARTKWRSRVDVDIIGVADSPNKLTTPAKTFRCAA
ncbi:hypothetical protein [Streptomyces sp. LaPpAH-108]|uniref:hypothetical protein n=1 Tax=Streptomyces sp. LaPpAH-108 TaxID=1155714 RepID=UPI0004755CB0|nr:hypothetical protein [Streptomyces sp. LaPpAH-108]